MGGYTALEQRQGRHQRDLLLRNESVAGRRAEAAAPRCAMYLGRLLRLLPRAVPPWRHLERFSQQLASASGFKRAAWRRRTRGEERRDGRACRRPRDAPGRGTPREPRRYSRGGEDEGALAGSQWTRYFVLAHGLGLGTGAPAVATTLNYETNGDGLTFRTPPLTTSLEITGPVAAKLWVSSETTDADLFLVLRLFDPSGTEVTFIGSNDPRVPVGLGWLRASHRKRDSMISRLYRPWHTHDEYWPLEPGEPVELDIEIWPTSIVVPAGYQLALTVRGKDYEVDGRDIALPHAPYPMKGVGPFPHIDPDDRPAAIFACPNTLHFAAGKQPYLLLPIIPVRPGRKLP